MAAPLEVLQFIIVLTARGFSPLEVVLGPPLEVVLSFVLVVPPLEVVLASGLHGCANGLGVWSYFPSVSCISCVITPLLVVCVVGGGVSV